MTLNAETIADDIKALALRAGFHAVGITTPKSVLPAGERFRDFVAAGYHGQMTWMEGKADRRADPSVLWPDVKSVIMLGMNYGPADNPLALLDERDRASISVYARNKDYHDIVKKALKRVARAMVAQWPSEVKVFVDTAPVLEKPLAGAAGLGWQGKHTNLVSRGYGSWLFLGAIYTTLDLPIDSAEPDHCGRCQNCLDICPTNAFVAPYKLDARRCISYLTIEYNGLIPLEFRQAMGNRIYGCDDCLAVCPWNKFASVTDEAGYWARPELTAPFLADLAQLDDPEFRQVFSGSPIKRIGRGRFIRNLLIAMGNSGNKALLPQIEGLLQDDLPVIRGSAIWALWRLDAGRITGLVDQYMSTEQDEMVRQEWLAATSDYQETAETG